MAHTDVRRGRDERLALLLAVGCSARQAAHRSGFAVRTVYRRLKDDAFQQQVQAVRSQIFERTASRLGRLGLKAAATLQALLDADSETIRLGAAREILQAAVRLKSTMEFEARIRSLEEGAYEPFGET